MQSFIGLALMVPEIIRGVKTLGPLNVKKRPGLNRVKMIFLSALVEIQILRTGFFATVSLTNIFLKFLKTLEVSELVWL